MLEALTNSRRVLQVSQVGLVKPQLPNLLQGLLHFYELTVGQECDGVLVPFVVDAVDVESD